MESSPLQALASSNAEALKATPREKIIDSVQGHRPLDGVAAYPPGEMDRTGHVYDYEQGENMMTEGGNGPEGGAYRRWPGVKYEPDDVKGKGEPSYSIEKALKEHGPGEGKGHRKQMSADIEMSTRPRSSGGRDSLGGGDFDRENPMWGDGDPGMLGRSTSGKRLSGGLKKRFGSIKRHLGHEN